MKEIKISISGQGMDNKASSPVSKEMEGDIAEMEGMDEEKFAAMAPKGAFTARGLNALVKATNKLLPMFGQTGDYPTFSQDTKVLPTDFVRVLAMFVTAPAKTATLWNDGWNAGLSGQGIFSKALGRNVANKREEEKILAKAGFVSESELGTHFFEDKMQEKMQKEAAQDAKVLPTDFVRVLAMFVTAIDDAIKDEIVGPEMAIDMESIKDDITLTTIAGKLEMLSKIKEFKKWLSEAPTSETNLSEASEYNMAGEEEAPVDAESLMMSRM